MLGIAPELHDLVAHRRAAAAVEYALVGSVAAGFTLIARALIVTFKSLGASF